jgi:23S rRNA (adenine2503-C2)-methyltransferase
MRDIKELNLEELEGFLTQWGEPIFHARQIFSWIYKKGILDFDEMTDLPFDLRKKLKEKFYLFSLKLKERLRSCDGTEKFLFSLSDGNFIEAVIIPTEKRITVCVSTQVGCRFRCFFCASGLSGFKRNLSCGEMLDEVLFLKNNSPSKKLTHIVFMGIGEPLDNYDNLLKAIRIINSQEALKIAARRITVSTCGIISGIKRLAKEGLQIELSISLHAADDKTRSQIMPINKKYPLSSLIKTCKEYIEKTNRQLTFEYILIKGMNSDLQSVQRLSKILKGLNCKINIIPANPVRDGLPKATDRYPRCLISNGANPVKECNIEPPSKLEILLFRDYLLKQGINVTLRKPRGQDIEAACGQLRLRYEKK